MDKFSTKRSGASRTRLRRVRASAIVIAMIAAFTTVMAGQATAQLADRPLPVTDIEQVACNVDSCSLSWTTVNDTSTLRAWDVHVNGEYRTWVPIPNGPTLEYGPGATDQRLRDIALRDRIRLVPVRFDGVWAPTEAAAEFLVQDYGPDFGPGLEVRDQDVGLTDVGDSSAEVEVVLSALLDDRDGWNGPAASVSGVEIVGTDSEAFRVERFVQGQLSCSIENCPRDEIQAPFAVSVPDQNGFGRAVVITFNPLTAGLHEATLVVSHNGRDETVAATLRGTAEDGIEFGPGIVLRDTSFGVVAVGDDFVDVEIPVYALQGVEDGWTGAESIVTAVNLDGDASQGFEILGFVRGQLSCPVANPDCERTPIDLPFEVGVSDQNGFGSAVVVRFSPLDVAATEVSMLVSHNGTSEVDEAILSGVGTDANRPFPIIEISDQGCDVVCAIRWTPTNDPGSLRSWDIHVNGQYRSWVPISSGPTLEFGPGAPNPRLARVEAGDVIRIVPVRPDGVWAPTDLATEFVVG